MNTLNIEEALAADLPLIAGLAARIWRAHYPGIISVGQIEYMLSTMYDLRVMRRELDAGVCYVRLLVDGQVRGFAAYGPASDSGEVKLHKLYLDPAFQRRGLGSALLRHVETKCAELGCRVLILAVNKRNTKAIAAYQKYGFSVRESLVADIGGGFVMDDYIMQKLIAGPGVASAEAACS